MEGDREKDRKDDVFVFSLKLFVPFSEIGNKKYVGQKRKINAESGFESYLWDILVEMFSRLLDI